MFGFEYDSAQDIYVSDVNAWQRQVGYHVVIDEISAVPAGMVIDCEPIILRCQVLPRNICLNCGKDNMIYQQAVK